MLAVPFDAARLEVTGAPVPVLTEVGRVAGRGLAGLGISETGTLVQIVGSNGPFPRSRLALVDFDGRRTLVSSADGRLGSRESRPTASGPRSSIGTNAATRSCGSVDFQGSSSMRRLTLRRQPDPLEQRRPADYLDPFGTRERRSTGSRRTGAEPKSG